MNFAEPRWVSRRRLFTPLRSVAFALILLAVTGLGWWALSEPAPPPDPKRIIDFARKSGVAVRDSTILEVAENVCASLRDDQSVSSAQGVALRQLGLSNPRHGVKFVFVAIDNRCPEVDDAGLSDTDEHRLTDDYRH